MLSIKISKMYTYFINSEINPEIRVVNTSLYHEKLI